MDISRKLAYYRKGDQKTGEKVVSSPLAALRDHFGATILYEEHPVLCLERDEAEEQVDVRVDLNILSRREFPTPVNLSECLFFDLETSGLIGGSGVYAFLIGFAWWHKGRIHTRRYFLPDYGREPRLFTELNPWFTSFNYIVSYNGKSFDLPVLNSRFLMNRQNLHLLNMPHIDLVHPVRRVWQNSFPSCDLQTLERELLGFHRSNDIPGAFIPQVYFDFLETGRLHDIVRVIEHNYYDLVSMVRLMQKLHTIFNGEEGSALDHPAICRLSRLLSGLSPVPLSSFDILEKKTSGPLPADYLFWKSMALKRAGRADQALLLWRELQNHPRHAFAVMEEIAKYLEHRLKKYKEALQVVERALHIMDIQREFGYNNTPLYRAFERRRKRLSGKSKAKN